METKNAIITKAVLDTGDRDLLTAWLYLDYGGSSQGFGGIALYLPRSYRNHGDHGYAGHFIYRCMQIAGVESWDKLEGRTIRAKCDHNRVHAIGHIVKEDWFEPTREFEELGKLMRDQL